jgi:Pyridoxamine 5'-phosphate oxidase.
MILTATQRAFLEEVYYAVVGTLNPDGTIQQTVVWYLLEDDAIRFSLGSRSIKARNLRLNPTITLTVEDRQRYLTLTGLATLGPASADLRRRLAIRYRGSDQAEAYLVMRPTTKAMASAHVTIVRVYGQGVK